QERLERQLLLVRLAQTHATVQLDAELGLAVESAEAVAERDGVGELVATDHVGVLRVFTNRDSDVEPEADSTQESMIERCLGDELRHARAARKIARVGL